MKKYIISITAVISLLAFYSFSTYNHRVDDLLKELGIPATEARNHIWKAFTGTFTSLPSNAAIKSYSRSKRVAVVQAIGTYVKNYLSSPDFVKQYQLLREEKSPVKPASVEQRVKNEIANLYRSLTQAENSYKGADTDLKPVYEESIRKYKQSINALENDYDPQHPAQMEGILTQYHYDMDDYRFRLQQFHKEYPADVKLFIRNRLQDFLLLSSTVDFDAQLIEESKVKKFANPEYEAKPQAWKYCFRAGKDATAAARKLAAQWLKEI